MPHLLAGRAQMAFTLGFHMLFAALGVGMPLLMVIAEGIWLRTGRPEALRLAKTWGRVTALTFAIGAVSGTVLSFELGLLWPRFMALSGGIIGPAFTVEGFAFFVEAIFISLYLYGWERLNPRIHWLVGLPVVISGAASSILVVAANAWMQYPFGVAAYMANPASVSPGRMVFQNPQWPMMAIHSTLACYAATAFAVGGVYAYHVLTGRADGLRRLALAVVMGVAMVSALALPVTGDRSAKDVAARQPVKLAAMESQFRTQAGAPLRIGGIPDPATRSVHGALEIPGLLSWLAYGRSGASVRGLDQVPQSLWPNSPHTHISYPLMVGGGFLMLGVGGAFGWALLRGVAVLRRRWLMWTLLLASPLGYIALETGWIVTEAGRQPWIISGVLRTADAVTPAAGVQVYLAGFVALYLVLGVTLVWLLSRIRHEEARMALERIA